MNKLFFILILSSLKSIFIIKFKTFKFKKKKFTINKKAKKIKLLSVWYFLYLFQISEYLTIKDTVLDYTFVKKNSHFV